MNHVVLDTQRCLHDGICVVSCPLSLLELETGANGKHPTSSKGERCLRCGHCVSVCTSGALELTFIKRAELRNLLPERSAKPEQAEQLLQSRRSTRRYRDALVPRELIERALDTARFAPSGLNSQTVAWTVVSGREPVSALAASVRDWAAELVAQKHRLAVGLDFARFLRAWGRGEDTILHAAPHIVIAHTPAGDPMGLGSATIAVTYFQLAAQALGLATCWAGYLQIALGMSPAIAKLAGIPDGRQATGATMLGYAKHEYMAIPPRKQLDVTWLG